MALSDSEVLHLLMTSQQNSHDLQQSNQINMNGKQQSQLDGQQSNVKSVSFANQTTNHITVDTQNANNSGFATSSVDFVKFRQPSCVVESMMVPKNQEVSVKHRQANLFQTVNNENQQPEVLDINKYNSPEQTNLFYQTQKQQFGKGDENYIITILRPLKKCITPTGFLKLNLHKPLALFSAAELDDWLGNFYLQQQKQYYQEVGRDDSQSEIYAHAHQFDQTRVFCQAVAKHLLDLQKVSNIGHMKLLKQQAEQSQSLNIQLIQLKQMLLKEFTYQRLAQQPAGKVFKVAETPLVNTAPVSEKKLNATFNKLYNDAHKKQAKMDKLRCNQEEKLMKSCTFKPEIVSGSRSTRDGFYGYDNYIQQRQLLLEDHDDVKVKQLMDEIIAEATSFKIKLTENFLAEVEQDLQSTLDMRIRRQIVQKVVDRFVAKHKELDRLKYQEKVKHGEAKHVKMNFRPDETMMVTNRTGGFYVDREWRGYYDYSQTGGRFRENLAKTQQNQIVDEKLLKQQQLKEKERKAASRAKIFKEFQRGGGAFVVDLKQVEHQYGIEGVKDVVGNLNTNVDVDKDRVVTLYSCFNQSQKQW